LLLLVDELDDCQFKFLADVELLAELVVAVEYCGVLGFQFGDAVTDTSDESNGVSVGTGTGA
jgi:hypothetical protein